MWGHGPLGLAPGPRAAGTVSLRSSLGASTSSLVRVSRLWPRKEKQAHSHCHGTGSYGGVSEVERRPPADGLDEIDHRPVVIAEQPVIEVRQRPAGEQPQT